MKYTYELIAIFNDGDKKVVKKSNKNINEIDEFTSQFNNKSELINHLEDLFDKVIFDAKIKYTYLIGVTKTEKTMDILYKNDVFDTKELIEKYSNYLNANETVFSIELMNTGSMKITKTEGSPSFIITASELCSSILSSDVNILENWKTNIESLINMMKVLPYQTLMEIHSSLDESNPIDKVIGFIIWMIVNENAATSLNYTVLGH